MKIDDVMNILHNKAGTTTVFSFRIDDAVYALVKDIAKNEGRSINKQLEMFIDQAIVDYVVDLEHMPGRRKAVLDRSSSQDT